MKKLVLAVMAWGGALAAMAQDSTERVDTIHVGGMVIIKKHGSNETHEKVHTDVEVIHTRKESNLSTNWCIFDFGFSNWNDKTNYAAAQASGFLGPGMSKDHLGLRSGKSVNVNIWFFMQKLNLVQHVVNLKYGLGLELNNYRFED